MGSPQHRKLIARWIPTLKLLTLTYRCIHSCQETNPNLAIVTIAHKSDKQCHSITISEKKRRKKSMQARATNTKEEQTNYYD